MFLVTLSNTEFTARELCQRCDVLASKKAQDALFFFSLLYFQSQYQSNIAHSRLCCLHAHKKKKNQMLTAPPISVFLLCIHGNKNSLFCLLGLYQRCPRRLAHNCV